jgi:hypothetical protein
MTNQHPITPPPELVQQWLTEWGVPYKPDDLYQHIATQSARWGADQELEACIAWLTEQTCFHPESDLIKDLRAARRPKSPTLKEQALAELGAAYDKDKIDDTTYDTIRRALEALSND